MMTFIKCFRLLGIYYSLIYTSNHAVSYSPILQMRKVRHRKMREIASHPTVS